MPEEHPEAPRARRPPPGPEPVELAVLYEDACLVAVDKPPGMVVHPTYRNWTGTLLNGLLWRFRDRASLEPRIVTRLDKDTSGIVIVALSSEIHAQVQRDMTARRVRKEYLAVVHGVPAPANGSIALPLGRSLEDRRRVIIDQAGRASLTDYEVLSTADGRSVVRCEPVTGRTHQIRVHLAARGWPIVGDRVYGRAGDAAGRQALHAWRVSLPHPASRQPLGLYAPPPHDLFTGRAEPSCLTTAGDLAAFAADPS